MGSGDGYGYGYGSGYGSGSGSGYGYGYGYGSGYGDGDDSGYGYGVVALARKLLSSCKFAADSFIALWLSDKDGKPANGGICTEAARVGLIQETKGPLSLCNPGTLHATLHPAKWKGDRVWIVAMHGELAFGDNKIGALKREILAEVKLT